MFNKIGDRYYIAKHLYFTKWDIVFSALWPVAVYVIRFIWDTNLGSNFDKAPPILDIPAAVPVLFGIILALNYVKLMWKVRSNKISQ